MRRTATADALLGAVCALVVAAAVLVPQFLAWRHAFLAQSWSPAFTHALRDESIVLTLLLCTSLLFGGVGGLLVSRVLQRFLLGLSVLVLLVAALLFGHLPASLFVYRNAPPGMHINVAHRDLVVVLLATLASLALSGLIRWLRRHAHTPLTPGRPGA